MIKYFCDKCGKPTDCPNKIQTEKRDFEMTATKVIIRQNKCFHLCDGCYIKFEQWVSDKGE